MLIDKAKSLVPVIDELAKMSGDKIEDGVNLWRLAKRLEYEEVLILQSIMYIGQQEHKPDPNDYRNYYAYEAELERFRPERMLKDYVHMLGHHYEDTFNRLHSMIDKRPLIDYLQNGLDMLRIRHVIEKRDIKTAN